MGKIKHSNSIFLPDNIIFNNGSGELYMINKSTH